MKYTSLGLIAVCLGITTYASASEADSNAASSAAQICEAGPRPVDVSRPSSVVGKGTPESCTEAALSAAVEKGGIITFDCGSAPTTIALSQPLELPSDRDTTLDGGDRITLDGQGSTQILRSSQPNFRVNDHVLTVQRMVLQHGRDEGTGFQAKDGDRLCAWGYREGGGGAIFTRDMNVHVWGVTFLDNQGPELGPDVAGGAIYMVGSKDLVVANSVFRGNSAANGGAIGLLHTAATLHNVLFEENHATGTNGNFAGATGCGVFNHEEQGGAGGLGGAFYSDGFENDSFCGVEMRENDSGDLGGAVFRSAYWGLLPSVPRQTIAWDRSTFEGNSSVRGGGGAAYVNNSLFKLTNTQFMSNDSGEGDGGALKLTGLTLQASNVQFEGNHAAWGGAVAHWGGGPDGAGSAQAVSFQSNVPNDAVGVFPQE
jgi:hypothetical protein